MADDNGKALVAERSRSAFFNLALDLAEADEAGRMGADEIEALQLQEQALRDTADMVAGRIRTAIVNQQNRAATAPA